MTRYAAKIKHLSSASAPDDYDPKNGPPDASLVVSRGRDGDPLSLYGELEWDRTPYDPEERTSVIHFQFWSDGRGVTRQREFLLGEMRWLMFLLIYFRPGHSLSNYTLLSYATLLRTLARFCEARNHQICGVLSSREGACDFADRDASGAKGLVALLKMLRQLGPQVVGFDVVAGDVVKELQEISRRYRDNLRQHPPIPTRIYSSVLSRLMENLQSWTAIIEPLSELAQECLTDPVNGVGKTRQKQVRKELGLTWAGWQPTFRELLKKHGLTEFWATTKHGADRVGLIALLSQIQMVCTLLITAYSGMRSNEVNSLPYNCVEQVRRDGTLYFILQGRVTKLTMGRIKRARWVTNDSGHGAACLAQRVSLILYKAKGQIPPTSLDETNKFFLFPSPQYLRSEKKGGGKNRPARLKLTPTFAYLRNACTPEIEEEDVRELELIDPHRAWRLERKFRVGAKWPLTQHQLRRSLALYAQRSGLVSLPSLKRQLHHITLAMTQYYARGSAFARDFIGTGHKEKHFGIEWQEAQPISQYIAYASHVLLADLSQLYGGHVQWIKTRLATDEKTVLENRAVTLRRFQKGELAYKPTPVGGCVNPGPCDKNPIDILHTDCVAENCKHMVGSLRKTEQVIAIKKREVDALEKDAPNLPETYHARMEYLKLVDGYERARTDLSKGASI